MEQQAYTTQEVIEALQNVGVAEEVVEYIVPIAGYESRVEGVPFTRDALDKLSPSWGIFQANVNSMAPGIFKAMNELGVEVPGMTEEQKKVLIENLAMPGQEKLINFTDEQKEFAANWFKNEADLNANALVFKYMLEQKMKDVNTNDFKVAIDAMYPMTVGKFNDPSNEDAQALKLKIEQEIENMEEEPTISSGMTEEESIERAKSSIPFPETTPKGEVVNPETGKITGEKILPHSGRKVGGILANKFLKNLDQITRFDKPEPVMIEEKTADVVPGVGPTVSLFEAGEEGVNKVFEFLRGR